jgi:hypothetical protein
MVGASTQKKANRATARFRHRGDLSNRVKLGTRVAARLCSGASPALQETTMATRRYTLVSLAALGSSFVLPAWAADADSKNTYDQESVLKDVTEFFGSTTEGLAKVVEKAFKEHGQPNAYIKGEEAAAAVTVGVRYGEGQLQMKSGPTAKVYWAGPSIGLDVGANASKVFALVYRLPRVADIYQRFPGVDGSLYFIGGAGVNYVRRNNIVVAPIRLGVGVRSGASVGYMHFRDKKSWNPL